MKRTDANQRRNPGAAIALVWLVLALGACSESTESAPREIKGPPLDLSHAGHIEVQVAYSGTVPEAREVNMRGTPACAALHPEPVLDRSLVVADGRVANAIVHIESGLGEHGYPVPQQPVEIDQKGCLYEPRVAAAMIFQGVKFVNSDPEAHNVRGRPAVARAWNFMISRQNASRTVVFDKPEIGIRVGCDIHPWMVAYLSIFDHPYFAVTPENGSVSLEKVPPGDYVVAVWHERLGTRKQNVTVPADGSVEARVVYEAGDLGS